MPTETEPGGPSLACDLRLTVSKGTYIRAIADDLGRRTGYLAHAETLVRTAVGPFRLAQAVPLAALEDRFRDLAAAAGLAPDERNAWDQQDRRRIQDCLFQDCLFQDCLAEGLIHPITEALGAFPVLRLPPQMIRSLLLGQKVCLSAEQVEGGLAPAPGGGSAADLVPAPGLRLAVHGPEGLVGICHLEEFTDEDRTLYRIVTKGTSSAMNVFYPNDPIQSDLPRGVALGFFDGVHRGHQDLLRTMVYRSGQKQLVPAVFTFPEHPLLTLSPESPFAGYLSSLNQRLQRFADLGIEEACLQPFTPDFAAIPAEQFLDEILGRRLNAHLVVVGKDYRFGCEGTGDVRLLQEWGERHDCEIIIVPEVILHGRKISSSLIRRLVTEGVTWQAASCLGFPYTMTGTVLEGKKLGHKLGFPTANIAIDTEQAIPAYGVYTTRTRVGNRTYESITNIGVRPTLLEENPFPNIESYLFTSELDLYGRPITVEFLQRLRPEAVFDSLLDLVAQVQEDLRQAKDYHRSAEQGYEAARIDGIPIRLVRTTRFAQATAVVTFRTRITRRQASLFSLLSRVMTASCRACPSRSCLSAALDSLYGASLEAEVSKEGGLLNIHFAINALMNWTDHTSPFAAALQLFFDLLLHPDLADDGLFQAAQMEAERSGLLMELLARENDKAKYAHDQCIKMLCGDTPFGLLAIGDRETLLDITREELTETYHQLRQELDCQIAVAGDLSNELLELLLQLAGQIRPGRAADPATDSQTPAKNAPRIYLSRNPLLPAPFLPQPPVSRTEYKNVEQARICLAFSGLKPYFSHYAIVDTLINSMLGGDVHSLLFEVVREELGLAYSVYSASSRYLSTLLVMAGVAPARVAEACAAIEQQIQNLAEGQFSDTLLERSKILVESQIRSIPDDLDSLLAHLMTGVTLGRSLSVADSLSLVGAVDRTMVTEQAARLRQTVCYILTAKEPSHV